MSDQAIFYVVLTVIGLLVSIATAVLTRMFDGSANDRRDLWKANKDLGKEISEVKDQLHKHQMATAEKYVPLGRFIASEEQSTVAITALTEEVRKLTIALVRFEKSAVSHSDT